MSEIGNQTSEEDVGSLREKKEFLLGDVRIWNRRNENEKNKRKYRKNET